LISPARFIIYWIVEIAAIWIRRKEIAER